MPTTWDEQSVPAAAFTEFTEPTTTRDAWAEKDRRTGAANEIASLNKTTIASMDRTEGQLSIAELIRTADWTEIL